MRKARGVESKMKVLAVLDEQCNDVMLDKKSKIYVAPTRAIELCRV